MLIELGKIREFAQATRSSNPAYLRSPDPVSPPTFLATSKFWSGPESNPMGGNAVNRARLLHGEQEFVFHGPPPRAGARLTGVTRVDKIYEKQGKRGGTMMFAETVTEFRDESGTLVAESRTTLIETSKPATDG
jgi:hypothetical protein